MLLKIDYQIDLTFPAFFHRVPDFFDFETKPDLSHLHYFNLPDPLNFL